jgi:hypothetical protein
VSEEVYALDKPVSSTIHKFKEVDISAFSFVMISKQLFGRLMITWGIFETET